MIIVKLEIHNMFTEAIEIKNIFLRDQFLISMYGN